MDTHRKDKIEKSDDESIRISFDKIVHCTLDVNREEYARVRNVIIMEPIPTMKELCEEMFSRIIQSHEDRVQDIGSDVLLETCKMERMREEE